MMKKITLWVCILCLLTVLAGCGTPAPAESPAEASGEPEESAPSSGEEAAAEPVTFSATTLYGVEMDESVFADASLTMVNVWATWCGPCVSELPELEKVSAAAQESGAQLLGVAFDVYDAQAEDGVSAGALEDAQQIVLRTGVTYPSIIPNAEMANGFLSDLMAFPTTFFFDSEGRPVGEPVLGARTAEEWIELLQERLAEAAA